MTSIYGTFPSYHGSGSSTRFFSAFVLVLRLRRYVYIIHLCVSYSPTCAELKKSGFRSTRAIDRFISRNETRPGYIFQWLKDSFSTNGSSFAMYLESLRCDRSQMCSIEKKRGGRKSFFKRQPVNRRRNSKTSFLHLEISYPFTCCFILLKNKYIIRVVYYSKDHRRVTR